MRLGVPLGAGRIGKRVRIPRGRATVKIVASEAGDAKARRPARTLLQLLNAREKVFRPQGFLFSGKDPVASLSL